MAIGIVIFPGTNCDQDTFHVLREVLELDVRYVWHEENDLSDLSAVILPGGFAHGDYLRTGAIARFSPVMGQVCEMAAEGKPVLGICNGFQVLLEAGLLPGAMLRNVAQRFISRFVHVRVENRDSPFLRACQERQVLRMPIAHGEGNYYCDPETLAALEANRRVVLRYCSPGGNLEPAANPNGSLANIAGICNMEGNVMGLMPHPERCSEPVLGGADGRLVFESLVLSVREQSEQWARV